MCVQGNRKAQYKLYHSNAAKMMGICMRYAGSIEEAEDWLQEAFIIIFKSLNKYSFKGSFEGWMRRVVTNSCLQHIRNSKKNVFLISVDDFNKIGNMVDKDVSSLPPFKAVSLIQQLPKGCRAVFNLFVIENMTHQEIAEMLGISAGTSKSQLNRARMLLKEKLAELGLKISQK